MVYTVYCQLEDYSHLPPFRGTRNGHSKMGDSPNGPPATLNNSSHEKGWKRLPFGTVCLWMEAIFQSNEKRAPGCLGFIKDECFYPFMWGLFHKLLWWSLLNNQYFMESKRVFFVPHLWCLSVVFLENTHQDVFFWPWRDTHHISRPCEMW